jgi:protein-disulfide isomerase
MNDYLFEHQDALAPRELIAGAVLLGLDIDRFTDDRRRHTYAERVREDFLSGVRSGVNGTPTFFINGVRHDGSFDFDTLSDDRHSPVGSYVCSEIVVLSLQGWRRQGE